MPDLILFEFYEVRIVNEVYEPRGVHYFELGALFVVCRGLTTLVLDEERDLF